MPAGHLHRIRYKSSNAAFQTRRPPRRGLSKMRLLAKRIPSGWTKHIFAPQSRSSNARLYAQRATSGTGQQANAAFQGLDSNSGSRTRGSCCWAVELSLQQSTTREHSRGRPNQSYGGYGGEVSKTRNPSLKLPTPPQEQPTSRQKLRVLIGPVAHEAVAFSRGSF